MFSVFFDTTKLGFGVDGIPKFGFELDAPGKEFLVEVSLFLDETPRLGLAPCGGNGFLFVISWASGTVGFDVPVDGKGDFFSSCTGNGLVEVLVFFGETPRLGLCPDDICDGNGDFCFPFWASGTVEFDVPVAEKGDLFVSCTGNELVEVSVFFGKTPKLGADPDGDGNGDFFFSSWVCGTVGFEVPVAGKGDLFLSCTGNELVGGNGDLFSSWASGTVEFFDVPVAGKEELFLSFTGNELVDGNGNFSFSIGFDVPVAGLVGGSGDFFSSWSSGTVEFGVPVAGKGELFFSFTGNELVDWNGDLSFSIGSDVPVAGKRDFFLSCTGNEGDFVSSLSLLPLIFCGNDGNSFLP